VLFLSGVVGAQTQRGTIVGTITDPTGAVIPNASVQVVNDETGAKFDGLSTSDGYYNIPYLPYGHYTLTANVTGFKTFAAQAVEVATATTTTLNIALEVGNSAEAVSVTASTVLLETTTSSVSAGVEQKLKDDLPVSNRRNPLAYLNTVPGYQPTSQSVLAGSRYASNNILLDGQSPDLSITSQGDFGSPALPSVESVGEFKVMLNAVPAEYGRSGGPTIAFATRSGTNDYHGAGYEYYDTGDLSARPWQAASRGSNTQHYFGFVAGGPVRIPKLYNGRNKSFFFADYSDIRNSSAGGASAITTLPTNAMRTGDFSAGDISPIYDAQNSITGANGAVSYIQFPGNIIPVSRESKVSKNLFDLLPAANRPGSVQNFVGALSPGQATQWLLFVKGDQYLSANDRISGSYQESRPQSTTASLLGANFGDVSQTRFERIKLDWSRNFSPHVSQQALIGVSRNWSTVQSQNYGQNLGAKAGLTGNFDGNCPRIQIDHNLTGSLDLCFNLASITAVTNWTANYALMMNRGAHTFKFGVDYLIFNQNFNGGSNSLQDAAGYYNFGGIPPHPTVSPLSTGQSTFLNYATTQTNSTGGNAWADFYLGLPGVAFLAAPTILGYRQKYFATFIQDDWRVSRKLTINAGLRWDLNVPYSEVHGQISRFEGTVPNPGAANRLGALVFYGTGPGQLGTDQAGTYHFRNFGPRLGFAYQMSSKTVIRAFAGILYSGTQNTNVDFASRYGYQAAGEPLPTSRFGVYYNWDQPFPQSVLGKTPNTDPTSQNGKAAEGQQPNGVAYAPANYMWSLSIQRELPFAVLAEAAYLSNNMKHGTDRLQLNYLPQQYWALGPLLDLPLNSPQVKAAGFGAPYPGFDTTQSLYQALRPYPQYLDVLEDATNGTSSTYHALILKAQKRFSSGLSFLANYTVSKYITDSEWAPGAFGALPTIANNRRLDKGVYKFDIPQRFVLSYSYDLPFGKGKKYLNHSRIVDMAVGGWTITGIQQYQSGIPASFTGSFNTSIPTITGLANRVLGVPTRSNLSCSDMQYGNPAKDYLFNAGNPKEAAATGRPLAFSPAGDYQVGNMPRIDPQARQCGSENENVALFKSFTIRESLRVRFGAESFNLLNRHSWVSGNLGQVITAPNFGEIVPSQPNGPRTVRIKLRIEF
jgi:hypothetical protein